MTIRNVLRTPDAARYLGLSVSYLEKLRPRGIGPKFVRMGRAVGYRIQDLDQWLDQVAHGEKGPQQGREDS